MTDIVTPLSRRTRGGFSGTGPVWLLVVVMTAATAGLLTMVAGDPPISQGWPVPWWCLAVFFFLAESYVGHVHFRRESHTLSLSELGIVIGLFVTTPGQLIAAQLVGAAAALVLRRRQRPIKLAFNLSQFALSTSLTLVVFRATVAGHVAFGPVGWVAALLATAVGNVATVLLVTLAIALAEGRVSLARLPHVLTVSLLGTFASASLSLGALQFAHLEPVALPLLLVPAAVSAIAFWGYTNQWNRREYAESLYDSMRATQAASGFANAIEELLRATQSIFKADVAEILLLPEDASLPALRSIMAPGRQTLLEPVRLTPVENRALSFAEGTRGAVLLPLGRKPHALDDYLAAAGLKDALVTALHGEERLVGMLVVGNRLGSVATFGVEEGRVMEAFGSHTAVLLEKGRLAQSLTELTERLRHQVHHDALTGLPNRLLFAEQVGAALGGSAGENAVLLFDLDDFKTINDSLGHAVGDDVLVEVARRLQSSLRGEETCARFGGDEFALLLPGQSAESAMRVAAHLVETLAAPMKLGTQELLLHGSIGIAATCPGQSVDDILRDADVAMYAAKEDGKRRFALYRPEMHERARRRQELVAALERAVDRGEIEVLYQPIVSLEGGEIFALEALARWRRTGHDVLVSPGEFIPLAEEAGLMIAVGRCVLARACQDLGRWRSEVPGQEHLKVSVNLSASQLRHPELAREVAGVLDETRTDSRQLILEITESSAYRDPEACIETMRKLRGLGVRLALDDFGTGYSSLGRLREFPLDVLKIAKPFVDQVVDDPIGTTFVESILRMANALELRTVAEGIEQLGQAEALRSLGCSLGQGFHFARPMDAASVVGYLVSGCRLQLVADQAG